MPIHLAIYLAGNILKGHEKESSVFWTKEDQEIIRSGLDPTEVSFLNPAMRGDDLSDQKSVFGRDMTQVYCANVVFVDARERRGLGVGAEMMWAKMHSIPILTLAPENSHYCKKEVNLLGKTVKNWIHPFILALSDVLVKNLEEGIAGLKHLLSGEMEIKGPESIEEAMHCYQEKQLSNDIPMQELLEKNQKLKERMHGSRTTNFIF